MKGNQSAKGYKRTEKEKQAIRERMKGNSHFGDNHTTYGMLGKKHSEETKQKMRNSAIEREKKKRNGKL